VLSRCLQFQLRNLSAERIAAYLEGVLNDEGIEAEPAALDTIAAAARGSMRDALSITDQAIAFGQGALRAADVADMLGLVGRDQLGALQDALVSGDAARVLAVTAELAEQSVDFAELLAELIAALHRMAVRHALGQSGSIPFSPEAVQLYYQIALLGYRDLQFAPDPRCGVEMTLLRMLTFAPADAVALPVAPLGAAATPAGGAGVSQAGSSGAGARPATVSGARTESGSGTAWHELVSKLEVSGVARMIAEHSQLVDDRGDVYRLRLDSDHDTLLSDAPVAALERALARNGRAVRVEVEIGAPSEETPARRFQRLREERQRAAEQALAGDHTVRSLLNEFGGRLDGVRPVE
jgi:DNA polymerase III subunit gamma/tau